MDDLFRLADDLGPEKIIHLHNSALSLKAVVAIDNLALGPAIGGVRMAPDVSATEAVRLARAMTLKNSAAGIHHGGAKSVIFADPMMPQPEKERLIRGFAAAIRELDSYIPGPDMGTDEICMAWIREEIGLAIGLPRDLGGIPLDEIGATGWGLFQAVKVGLSHLSVPLRKARLVVQGFGAVGSHVARFLVGAGARLVAACDIDGAIHNPNGLDPERMTALRLQGRKLEDYPGAKRMERDAVLEIESEIWVPAARPDTVTRHNVGRLRTRLVAEGANIPITFEAERILHQRGVLVWPDFIANAGGVICGAVEYRGGAEAEAMSIISDRITNNVRAMLHTARHQGVTPREAAEQIAIRRVRQAMGFKRFQRVIENGQPEPRNEGGHPCIASDSTGEAARA